MRTDPPTAAPDERVAALERRVRELESELQRHAAEADAERHRAEARLRLALAAARVGLWTWSRADDRVDWDARLCEIFGVEFARRPRTYSEWRAALHPDDRARVEAHVAEAMRTGEYGHLEHRVVWPDGAVRWIHASGAVHRGAGGAVEGLVGAVLDVTEHRALEERAWHAQKMEAVSQLAHGVAHHFNNLLAVVIPNVELAARGAPPEAAAFLADARDAAAQAAVIVRELLLLAGSERQSERQRVDLGAVVRKTVELCRNTFDCRIAWSLDVAPGRHVVACDVVHVEQALLNVLLNARDAVCDGAAAPGAIRVSVASGVGAAVVRVEDTGPGVEEHLRPRVFEPFFTTKAPGKGTGLGLSTAYAILADHGGGVTCEAAPGGGAAFVLSFPSAPDAHAEDPRPSLQAPRGDGERVLVVDDERALRKALRAVLEGAGYVVSEAADGEEALAVLAGEGAHFDLMILDHSMPRMTGADVLARLPACRPGLPVVGYSGLQGALDGVDAMVTKPARPGELLAVVRAVLDRAR